MFIARVLEYDVWGNEEGGFDVNNVFEIAKIKLNGKYQDLEDWQILKRLNNKLGFKPFFGPAPVLKFNRRNIEIDNNNMSDNLILLNNKQNGAPIGRIELLEVDDGKTN